ncbi:MAG: hypothetical protein ABJ327_15120 [Litoreibacter sp.]
MTNRLAAILAILLLALIAVNFWLGWELHIFLGIKLIEFTEYLAFWR